MGFDLKTLFKLCDKKFDLITTLNIGIDIIKNLKILHEAGFIHRDLKPDNLVFGPLCEENIKYKNDIGISDFGNSKFLKKKNGSINYTSKFYKCRGNRMFSSSNELLDIDIQHPMMILNLLSIFLYIF